MVLEEKMIPSNEYLGGFMIALYVMVGIGTCLAIIQNCEDRPPKYHFAVVIIGSWILGATWPIFWAAKITQKLMSFK